MKFDKNNPSFQLAPVNNNRTAWRPFGLPIILAVPHKRTQSGTGISNSQVFNVKLYIEDVPEEARVIGHNNIGIRSPDRELYAETINTTQLAERIINIKLIKEDAKTDDVIEYITTSGVKCSFNYQIGTDYYDLSDITIDVELLPPDNYNIVAYAEYFTRLVSRDERADFFCIDASSISIAILRFFIRHPGPVFEEFHRLTPPPYATNTSKALDTTLELYRPFTDMLQDVADEQELAESINWVFETPPEAIPYLSSILGWDLPYFPESLDKIRRSLLRRTVEFQNLVGSKRAVSSLFKLFGFDILVNNLWWSEDGTRLIEPDKDEIITTEYKQIDVLLKSEITRFKEFEIPLLYRPQTKTGIDYKTLVDNGSIKIDTYTVKIGSEEETQLLNLIDEIIDNNNFDNYPPSISHETTAITEEETNQRITFNRETNYLTIKLGDIQNGYCVYSFASYTTYKTVVPEAIKDLQSNRFNVQILSKDTQEFANPSTLEFAVEFLYKIKAFHSLLNLIRYNLTETETYAVTDICVGGDIQQRYDIDMGRLQVPPAIIPAIPGDISVCTLLDAEALGYKEEDIKFRLQLLKNLLEEYEAWIVADPTGDLGQGRVKSEREESEESQENPIELANKYVAGYSKNPRLTYGGSINRSGEVYNSFIREFAKLRDKLYELDDITDYCYKGRVDDEILHNQTLLQNENYKCKPCSIGMGNGIYWTYPSQSIMTVPGTKKPAIGSKSQKAMFSGNANQAGIKYYSNEYLTPSYDQRLPSKNNSHLGKLYRDYGEPKTSTIHFTNRNDINLDQKFNLALERPNLGIDKATMHLPGCRFIWMNALESDYIAEFEARPWDFDGPCGPPGMCLTAEPTYLNFRKVKISGNEFLEFDDERYTLSGNGLTQDVPLLGDHSLNTGFDESDVIHKVYMKDSELHPAISFEGVCDYDTNVFDGKIETENPIFSSFKNCGANNIDFADGYGCVIGFQNYSLEDVGDFFDVLDSLGLPLIGTDTPISLLFFLGSGILVESGLRLDCGCSLVDCGTESSGEALCGVGLFVDENGDYDWDCDHLNIEQRIMLDESIGVCDRVLDGSIQSLLELSI